MNYIVDVLLGSMDIYGEDEDVIIAILNDKFSVFEVETDDPEDAAQKVLDILGDFDEDRLLIVYDDISGEMKYVENPDTGQVELLD